jgi:hypothetical protein
MNSNLTREKKTDLHNLTKISLFIQDLNTNKNINKTNEEKQILY